MVSQPSVAVAQLWIVSRYSAMTPKLLMILVFVWCTSELCLTRRSGPDATSKDQGSFSVLWLVEMVSLGCGVLAAVHFPAGGLPERHLFYVLGVCVFAIGLVLRLCSIIYLGRFFTFNVAIATDHRLIDSGPYRFVRHPSYTGALMLSLRNRPWPWELALACGYHRSDFRRVLVAHGDRRGRADRSSRRAISLLHEENKASGSDDILILRTSLGICFHWFSLLCYEGVVP